MANHLGGAIQQIVLITQFVDPAHTVEIAANLFLAEMRPQEGATHPIAFARMMRLALVQMPRRERRAERAAGISRGGLHPHVAKQAFAQDLAVRHAIERDAAGQA